MRIDGTLVAQEVVASLRPRIEQLKKRAIIPTLAIILVGNDPASLVYIRHKKKLALLLAGKVRFKSFKNILFSQLKKVIQELNADPLVHGIILQLPLPANINSSAIVRTIEANKDVDGFLQNSPYTQPVASAVLKVLEWVYSRRHPTDNRTKDSWDGGPDVTSGTPPRCPPEFLLWLCAQSICVLGRGQTAGQPIAETLQNLGCTVSVIHTQTKNPQEIIKNADIIISCVGKRGVVTGAMIKSGAIVIGVGLHQKNGRLGGDYDESDIAKKAAFYTPTPKGVGPVNVACLWENVVKAAEQ